MTDVFVASAVRTPMGGFQGALAPLTGPQLGAIALREVLARAGLADSGAVDEVLMGCVLPAGVGQAPARQAARQAGLPDAVGATTLNKVCGSGMKAVMLGTDLIRAGSAGLVLAGGMESMTNAPYLLDRARSGYRMGHGKALDHMFLDGLEDAETGKAMGSFAQDTADQYQLSREDMDNFAIRSLERANAAISNNWQADELVPVTVPGRKGDTLVSVDEQPGRASAAKIPTLRPAFKADGTITAANASSISDGASALLLGSADALAAQGISPLARVVAHVSHARHPSEFTIAPIGAIEKVLAKAGWERDQVDLFEINEAFAMVTMLAIRELGLDDTRVNILGGACAQGHPIGSTGSRLLVTLVHALRRTGGQRGIASLCIGGGEATAVAVELVANN